MKGPKKRRQADNKIYVKPWSFDIQRLARGLCPDEGVVGAWQGAERAGKGRGGYDQP